MNFDGKDPATYNAHLVLSDDKNEGLTLYDPKGYVKDWKATITLDSQYVYTTFSFSAAKKMADTAMIVSAWDSHRRINNVLVNGAIQFGQDPPVPPDKKPDWLRTYNNVHDADLAVEGAGYLKPKIFAHVSDAGQVWKGSDGGFVQWIFDSKHEKVSIVVLDKNQNQVYQKTEGLQKDTSLQITSPYSYDSLGQLDRTNTAKLENVMKSEEARVITNLQNMDYVNYFTHHS